MKSSLEDGVVSLNSLPNGLVAIVFTTGALKIYALKTEKVMAHLNLLD